MKTTHTTYAGNSKKSKKKRQAESEAFPSTNPKAETIRGRNYTTSIAVAASTASDPELIACTAGALCRAAVAGEIDEVVIYDDGHGASGLELAVALQYLETPPYLRKALCPMSPKALASLKPFCGLLRPPHHLGQADWRPYREGVVLKSSGSGEKGGGGGVGHSFLDVGLDRMAFVAAHLPVHARVTVSLGEAPVAQFVPEYSETMVIGEVMRNSLYILILLLLSTLTASNFRFSRALQVVSAITPRIKLGTYWGFTVRHEKGLGRVLKGCPFKGGYDLTIGTSGEK